MPKTLLMLTSWDESKEDGFEADVKIKLDEIITEHLGIKSIMFLSERLIQLFCESYS